MAATFTRDPEVEAAAMSLLGMSADSIKRMRIPDLRNMVKQYVEDQDAKARNKEPCDDQYIELPTPANVSKPRVQTPRSRSRLDPLDVRRNILGPSELGMAADMSVLPVAQTSSIRQAAASLPDAPEMKGIEYLTAPINVNEWCNQQQGMERLSEHLTTVLSNATELEESIKTKKQIQIAHSSILDAADSGWIDESVEIDIRQLHVISKYLTAILDDLNTLIRARLEAQSKLESIKRGNCTALIEKIHAKTLKLRAIHNVVSARRDVLQIPSSATIQ